MSLRMRLFLIFGGLIALLTTAQWWMLRTMTRGLEQEIEKVALHVSSDVASVFAPAELGSLPPVEETYPEQAPEPVEIIEEDKAKPTTRWTFSIRTSSEEPRPKPEPFKGKVLIRKAYKQSEDSPAEPVEPLQDFVRQTAMESLGVQELSMDDEEATIYLFPNEHNHDVVEIEVSEQQPKTDLAELIKQAKEKAAASGDSATSFSSTFSFNSNSEKTFIVPTIGGASWVFGGDKNEVIEDLSINLNKRPDGDNFLLMRSPSIKKEIPIPTDGIETRLAGHYSSMFLGSLLILIVGLLVAAMVAHRFSAPLRRLASTAQTIGAGRLGAQVAGVRQSDEVGIAIREFNKMSQRLQELDAQAELMRRREYLSELGEIADGLAHTIRNPLNTLGLSVDQLSGMAVDNPHASEMAQTARQQIRRIDQWIRSFMALASQGQGCREDVRLDGMLHDVMLEAMQESGAAVDFDLDMPDELPTVQAVPAELRAVIQALVVNAVEAASGDEDGKVVVRMRNQGEKVVLEVEDNGPGLPQEVRDKLFTPHVTTKVTGSGMGLFLARRIITTRYNGELALEDVTPHGVLARVVIPQITEAVAHV